MSNALISTFRIAGWVIGGFLLAFLLFMLAMTQPRFGTPTANWLLSSFGPEGSKVERAHTRFPAILVVEGEGLDIPGRVSAQTIEGQLNLLGWLPFMSWLSYLEAANGTVQYDDSDNSDDGGEGPGLQAARDYVDAVRLDAIEMHVLRAGEESIIQIDTARGSLRSGELMVEASGAGSTLSFDGRTSSALSELDGALRVTGDNFADIAALAGLAAPDTPPYDMQLSVDITADSWTLDIDPATRIGDSDLAGKISVNPVPETPVVTAELVSEALDADDLGIVFGIPVGIGEEETTGDVQTRARRAYEQSDRLIPNVVIDFTRLDAVDGSVSYSARSITDAIFDVRALELDFEIEGRVVRAPTLLLEFAQGEFRGFLTLDATRSPAHSDFEADLNDVSFENLSLAPYLRGTADGKVDITAVGDGFRAAAASMDGTASIWSTDAEILALAAEGAALDMGETLTVLGESPDNRTYVTARCAAIVASLEDGIGSLEPAVVDTNDSLVVVRGDANLRNEQLKLSIRSEAKDASLGTLVGDVALGGSFQNPSIQPFSASTVAQIGIAGILGSLSGGLAALPFIEPGTAQDASCGSLLARAQSASERAGE
jgi:uncharacterized protein involved in outer membrane biogenesis